MWIQSQLNRLSAKGMALGVSMSILVGTLSGCAMPQTMSVADAYVVRAENLQRRDTGLAQTAYDKAVEYGAKDAEIYHSRGRFYYFIQNDKENAFADFAQAAKIDPKYIQLYLTRGYINQLEGDLDSAVSDIQEAIDLNPQNAASYNNMCWIYGVFNKPEEAVPFCEKAVSLNDDYWTHDSRGLVYALLGENKKAIADFQIFVDWVEKNGPELYRAESARRQAWIASLENGKNPFTDKVLDELRTE